MTKKKRFTRDGYIIWDNVKNEEFYELHYRYECEDMCDYLNEYEDKVNELTKENEQLKNSNEGKIQELESEISAYKELIRDLKRQISVRDNIIADVEKAICGD